jgi:ABC-type uncharacterized transport system permease subunit
VRWIARAASLTLTIFSPEALVGWLAGGFAGVLVGVLAGVLADALGAVEALAGGASNSDASLGEIR